MTQIKINIPEGYEIDVFNKETGEVSFKKIEVKYPQSVKEILNRNYYIQPSGTVRKSICHDVNNVSSEQRAEAFLALMQLVELRDAWNKIDGFIVDWNNINQNKYVLEYIYCKVKKDTYGVSQKVLYFSSAKTRDLFLKTFSSLINTAKELL
jgi:hypothetical protein